MIPERKKEIGALVLTAVMVIGYVLVNSDMLFKDNSVFILTTIGVFAWLTLVILFVIHELCEEVAREMRYTIEDNVVEIKLLKDVTERQLRELEILNESLRSGTRTVSAAARKKR